MCFCLSAGYLKMLTNFYEIFGVVERVTGHRWFHYDDKADRNPDPGVFKRNFYHSGIVPIVTIWGISCPGGALQSANALLLVQLHCALSCDAVYCNWSCLCVCGSVITITWNCVIDPHQTGFVVTISSWLNFGRPALPGRGLRQGENFWLRLTTASAQCLRLPERFFSFNFNVTNLICVSRMETIRSFNFQLFFRSFEVLFLPDSSASSWCHISKFRWLPRVNTVTLTGQSRVMWLASVLTWPLSSRRRYKISGRSYYFNSDIACLAEHRPANQCSNRQQNRSITLEAFWKQRSSRGKQWGGVSSPVDCWVWEASWSLLAARYGQRPAENEFDSFYGCQKAASNNDFADF